MLCEHEYRTRFLPRLCVATENIWWGGKVWGSSFLNSLHAHIRSAPLLLAHSCEEKYSLQAAEGQKAQFGLGFSALMPHGEHYLNCRIEKG